MTTDLTCGSCRWRVLEQIDPSNVTAPRQGTCRRRPPALTMFPQQGGVLNLVGYPIVAEHYAACGEHTPLPKDEPPGAAADWWNRTLREVLDARARGQDFLADCLMGDLDARLRHAEAQERRELLERLLGLEEWLNAAETPS